MPVVTLTKEELKEAARIGSIRQAEAIRNGNPEKHGCNGGVEWHIMGCNGELAACKVLGVKWEKKINTYRKEADIGKRIEVKYRSKRYYDLIIRKDDNPDSLFILVVPGLDPNSFNVKGCIWGRDGMKKCYVENYGNRGEAFFVPQNVLMPMEEIIKSIRKSPGTLKLSDNPL